MLVLVRHGRTAANAARLLQGRSDHPLDDTGRGQAAACAAAIGPVDLVVSSPLRRAVETAEALGFPVTTDDRFAELSYGDWEDRPLADVSAETWAGWQADPDFAPPGGESHRSLSGRVREAMDELAPRAVDQSIVIVSHVSPIKIAISWALEVDDEAMWRMWLAQAAISRIGVGADGRTVLISYNETAHLAALV